MIRRSGLLVVAAMFGLLMPATSVSAGQPVTQALNPPPPSFETCMAVGSGTICDGARVETYSQDAGIACGSGSNAVELHDSGIHMQHATRYYDLNGNLTRRYVNDGFTGQWSNPLNGASIGYYQHNVTIDVLAVPGNFASATETLTGETNFTDPHVGAVFLNAGRTVVAPDGGIEFLAGPDGFVDYFVDGDTSVLLQLCSVLGVAT